MPPRRYYFRSTDGDILGPVSLNVVAEMIQADRVKANTPISIDGADFRPMKSFPELATLLSVDLESELPEDIDVDDLMDTPPTYSGSLTDVSLPKLIYHFIAAKVTGCLQLTNQAVKKEIYLVNGKPVAATSNLPRDQLGQHLVRQGVLDARQLDRILAEIANKDERLGDYLIQRGMVTPHDLVHQLTQQLLEKIYEMFNWRVGEYAFFDGRQYDGSLLPMNMNPWEILAEGVRQGYEANELRTLLEPFMNRVLIRKDNGHVHLNSLGLHPRELKLFKLASGQRSLGLLLEQLTEGVEDHRTLLTMVYLGLELDLLTLGEEMEDLGEIPGEFDASVHWGETMAASSAAESAGDEPDLEDVPFAATPPVSRAEQKLLETLNEMKNQDFFARLGIEYDAGSSDVSRAFMQAARQYHPDHVPADASEQVRQLTSEIFALLNEAQQKLSDDNSRGEYLEALEAGHSSDQVDVGKIMEAEAAFQKGEVLLNARKYKQALGEFDRAVELNPDEGEFYIYRGYARFMADPDMDGMKRRQCSEMILRGLQMRDDNVADGYLFLGRIEVRAGNDDKAAKMFKKALSIEGNHVEATRELRLLNMRKEKDKKPFWRRK